MKLIEGIRSQLGRQEELDVDDLRSILGDVLKVLERFEEAFNEHRREHGDQYIGDDEWISKGK